MISRVALVLALLSVLVGVGCGSGKGSVEGRLTVAGQPVTTGALITFIGSNGEKAQATVNKEGRFSADHVPSGLVNVTVENAPLMAPEDPFKDAKDRRLPPYKMGEKPPPQKPAVLGNQVPAKYRNTDGGLTQTINAGPNTLAIDLTP